MTVAMSCGNGGGLEKLTSGRVALLDLDLNEDGKKRRQRTGSVVVAWILMKEKAKETMVEDFFGCKVVGKEWSSAR